MQITISIGCSNTSFRNSPEDEFVRILEELIEDTNPRGLSDGPILAEDRATIGYMQVEGI